MSDLRWALRGLIRSPGFVAVAAGTLALGIGATTAVFGLLDAALLRPLAVEAPDRLVKVVASRPDGVAHNLSYPAFEAFRDGEVLADAVAQAPGDLALGLASGGVRIRADLVSAGYFRLLGVRPALGRGFGPSEAVGGDDPQAIVLGHRLWERDFGADPGVVGRTIPVNGVQMTVVGVAPDGFSGMARGESTEAWVPVAARSLLQGGPDRVSDTSVSWLYVLGRLPPDTSREAAEARLQPVAERIARADLMPDVTGAALLEAGRGFTTRVDDLSARLKFVLAAVGLLLLIACANVAGLLLARGTARRREIATRLALGARRWRLTRQLLVESSLLALVGAAGGVILGHWAAEALAAFGPAAAGVALDARLDGRAVAFAALLTGVTTLVFGGAPAVLSARRGPAAGLLGSGGRGGTERSGARGRRVLVAGQVALSLVLLVVAGLLGRSLRKLSAVDPGFDASGVLAAAFDLEAGGYDAERGREFTRELLARVRALPGVEGASLASTVPPSPGGSRWDGVGLQGYEAAPDEEIGFDMNRVGTDYFEILRIPLLRGRTFDARDGPDAPLVAIVNETMARRYWPDGEAVGRRILLSGEPDGPSLEIVGVAADGKYRSLREEPRANVYVPFAQIYRPGMTLLARGGGDPHALVAPIRGALRSLDPGVPLFDVRTLEEQVAAATAEDRVAALAAGAFGLLALLMAAVGLYGLLAYTVGRRVRELGIRMALGARRAQVIGLVLAGAVKLVVAGVAVGIPVALLAGGAAEELLYGVSPGDPATMAVAALLLLGVALFAAFVPARRAAAVQPARALREE